jgi:hypothetical protein
MLQQQPRRFRLVLLLNSDIGHIIFLRIYIYILFFLDIFFWILFGIFFIGYFFLFFFCKNYNYYPYPCPKKGYYILSQRKKGYVYISCILSQVQFAIPNVKSNCWSSQQCCSSSSSHDNFQIQRLDISFFGGYYILSIPRPPKRILYPIA